MKDLWDYISNWPVLKWVIVVLVAGFIGQFGKMLAEAIITKIRRRREEKRATGKTEAPAVSDFMPKAPAPRDQSAAPSAPAVGEVIPDKKMLKALAKARKKEAKKNK